MFHFSEIFKGVHDFGSSLYPIPYVLRNYSRPANAWIEMIKRFTLNFMTCSTFACDTFRVLYSNGEAAQTAK